MYIYIYKNMAAIRLGKWAHKYAVRLAVSVFASDLSLTVNPLTTPDSLIRSPYVRVTSQWQ